MQFRLANIATKRHTQCQRSRGGHHGESMTTITFPHSSLFPSLSLAMAIRGVWKRVLFFDARVCTVHKDARQCPFRRKKYNIHAYTIRLNRFWCARVMKTLECTYHICMVCRACVSWGSSYDSATYSVVAAVSQMPCRSRGDASKVHTARLARALAYHKIPAGAAAARIAPPRFDYFI